MKPPAFRLIRKKSPPCWKAATRRLRSSPPAWRRQDTGRKARPRRAVRAELEKVDKLAENQRLVAVGGKFDGEVGERRHLGAGDAEFRTGRARITGGTTESGQLGKDVEACLPGRCLRESGDFVHRLSAQRLVMRGFGRFRGDGGSVRCAAGKSSSTWAWSGAARKGRSGVWYMLRITIAVPFDRPGEAFVESCQRPEEAGLAKRMIDHSSARRFSTGVPEGQAEIRVELEHRLRTLCRRVLDRLRLVGHQVCHCRAAKRSLAS